jgi:hypothetical protein
LRYLGWDDLPLRLPALVAEQSIWRQLRAATTEFGHLAKLSAFSLSGCYLGIAAGGHVWAKSRSFRKEAISGEAAHAGKVNGRWQLKFRYSAI